MDFFSPSTMELASWVASLVAALLGVVVASLSLWSARSTKNKENPEEETLQDRIAVAHQRLHQGAQLIQEITAEIETKRTTLEKLRVENEKNQRLAELNQEQAKAVSDLVESTVARGNKKLNRSATLQQSGFFVAGLLLSPFVQVFIGWAWKLFTAS